MPLSRVCQNSDEFIGPFVKGRVLDGCAFPQISQRWKGCGSRLGAELFSVKKILLAKVAERCIFLTRSRFCFSFNRPRNSVFTLRLDVLRSPEHAVCGEHLGVMCLL